MCPQLTRDLFAIAKFLCGFVSFYYFNLIFKNRVHSMRDSGGFDNGTGERVLNKLKTIKLRFREIFVIFIFYFIFSSFYFI